MSSDRQLRYLRDVVEAIEAIRIFIEGMDEKAYLVDLKTQAAVERKLQIITEALIRIGRKDMELLCPNVDWRSARNMGNFLRHEYERVSNKTIWKTTQEDLPELEQSARKALEMLQS